MTTASPNGVVGGGPVFISYRQSDGTKIANEFCWLLRAAGVPVWRDLDDLPPGDTHDRLQQALTAGLSGAILIVTPDIEKSDIVKFVELPRLLALHAASPDFAFAVANAIERTPGQPDYTAPDRVLAQSQGTLSRLKQFPTSNRQQQTKLAQAMLWHRIDSARPTVAGRGGVVKLNIQTRNAAQVYDRTAADMDIRTRPPTHPRLPNRDGLLDIQVTFAFLADAVTRSGASTVQISGGAHLSVAFALGAALPSTRLGSMEVMNQLNQSWLSGTESRPGRPHLTVETAMTDGTKGTGRPQVAVYLDLIHPRSDSAYQRFLDQNTNSLSRIQVLRMAKADLIDPRDAGAIAAEAAFHIRELSNRHQNATVHLLIRGPFPLAILLGRLTNTLNVVAYEWDDSETVGDPDSRPKYVPCLQVRSASASGAIADILI